MASSTKAAVWLAQCGSPRRYRRSLEWRSILRTVSVLPRVSWQDVGIRFRVSDADLMSLLARVLPLACSGNVRCQLRPTFRAARMWE